MKNKISIRCKLLVMRVFFCHYGIVHPQIAFSQFIICS